MCDEKDSCAKPGELKSTPKECTPEQVQECHGDTGQHPCCSCDSDN